MTDFGVTYDEMETTASKLDDGKESIDDALTECQGYVDDLVQEGFKTEKASDAYKDGYDDMTQGLKDAAEGVAEMATALRDKAQQVRDLDDAMAG